VSIQRFGLEAVISAVSSCTSHDRRTISVESKRFRSRFRSSVEIILGRCFRNQSNESGVPVASTVDSNAADKIQGSGSSPPITAQDKELFSESVRFGLFSLKA
jgi:hypothetical protein